MLNNSTDLLSEVADYYSSKLIQHGETALGVDWNGEQSQTLRFEQLCKIIDEQKPFSINDIGCGYGAMVDYLHQRYQDFNYFGIDIAEKMIEAAKERYQGKSQSRFLVSNKPDQIADYGIASGIFNVRLKRKDDEWLSYLTSTLDLFHETSRLGFAFNCLTSYSDADKMRDYLYYADPLQLFDLCKRRYSRHVALLHDYGLYEFTLLVRK